MALRPSQVPGKAVSAGGRIETQGPLEQIEELTRSGGPLRRALAAVAGRLVDARSWERLGFARLSDYARERLGLSARQVQDLARVDARLAELPRIEAALLDGSLSWTQARLCARVATPETEERWLALALRCTARAFAHAVREVDTRSLDAPIADRDEPSSRLRETIEVRCTPQVRAQWNRAQKLARQVAGERLPAWECMEAVAAEAVSALGLDAERPALWELAVEEGEERSQPTESPCPRRRRLHRRGVEPVRGAERTVERLPAFLRSLLAGLGEADAFELDRRLRRAVRLEQRLEAQLGPALLALAEGRLHRGLGFRSLDAYASVRLDMSPRKLRSLLRLERVGRRRPGLARAFHSGRLSWVRAHALVPVVLLSSTWQEAWVDRADRVSVRRLEEDVEQALVLHAESPNRFAETGGLPPEGAERQTGAQPRDSETAPTPPQRTEETAWFFFGAPREVAHAFHTWAAQDATAARAHAVYARDGWRCTVPGCSSYRNLHRHHIQFRSRGGSDHDANCTTVCAWHHQRGIHGTGVVGCQGTAPEGLRFELGVRGSAPPLVTYRSGDLLEATEG